MNIKKVFVLFGVAMLLAIFEIQIEGASGWAKSLPCWRVEPGSWMQYLYGALMNDKPLDGFHLSEVMLLVLMFHLPFVYGAKWSLAKEGEVLASFFVMAVCWDFLWFEFNPAYGWANFNGSQIWWHSHWLCPFPKDYYGGIGTASILVFLTGKFSDRTTAKHLAWELVSLLGLTGLSAIVAEIIR
jgi:hypothetical protein